MGGGATSGGGDGAGVVIGCFDPVVDDPLSGGSDGDALPYLLSKDVANLLPGLKNLQTLVMEMATADE